MDSVGNPRPLESGAVHPCTGSVGFTGSCAAGIVRHSFGCRITQTSLGTLLLDMTVAACHGGVRLLVTLGGSCTEGAVNIDDAEAEQRAQCVVWSCRTPHFSLIRDAQPLSTVVHKWTRFPFGSRSYLHAARVPSSLLLRRSSLAMSTGTSSGTAAPPALAARCGIMWR